MWILQKVMIDDDDFRSPPPSFILDISPQFLNLLGYNDLSNSYFPDLIPKKHHHNVAGKDFTIKIENVKGLISPKINCKKKAFLKHSKGHYVSLDLNCTGYLVNKRIFKKKKKMILTKTTTE